jgi:hypothetical protein
MPFGAATLLWGNGPNPLPRSSHYPTTRLKSPLKPAVAKVWGKKKALVGLS